VVLARLPADRSVALRRIDTVSRTDRVNVYRKEGERCFSEENGIS
jgi:hypothetical protein